VLRPLFAEFPNDPRCLADGDDMMLGSSLLVAPVVEQGQRERDVYLPAGVRWASYWSGEVFEGGQSVTLPAPFEQPVMLLREGSVVPLNVAEQHFAQPADERAFIALPFEGTGTARGGCVEDDGETEAWRDGMQGRWNVAVASDATTLRITIDREGQMPFVQHEVQLSVPASEARAAICTNGEVTGDVVLNGWRRLTLRLAHP
jgi:alpha-glucosidase